VNITRAYPLMTSKFPSSVSINFLHDKRENKSTGFGSIYFHYIIMWYKGGHPSSDVRVGFGASSWVQRGYVQQILVQDVDATFDRLKVGSGSMEYNPKSMEEMKYRGNELRRTKMFLVKPDLSIASERDRDIAKEQESLVNSPVYTYPGFQYASVYTYKDLDNYPLVSSIATHCSTVFNMHANHVIVTSYKRATVLSGRDDLIGPHRDRIDTLTPDKPIIIVTYGDDSHREFVITTDDDTEVFRCRTEPGTLIYMSYEDNVTYKHQLVAVKDEQLSVGEDKGVRGYERVSLVLRDINQVVPISEIERRTRLRDRTRAKRKRERESWFSTGRYVHNRTDCDDAIADRTSVCSAKGKRFCGKCFPVKVLKICPDTIQNSVCTK
jgi:hypothetical protein